MHQPDGVEATTGGVPASPGTTSEAPTAAAAVRILGVHWWIVIGLIVLDQITKYAITMTIPLYGSVTVIPDLLNLVHVRNPGVAFGFLNNLDPAYQKLVTSLLALTALVGIAYYARQVRPEEWLARLGLSVILGGALGNLFDRLRQGFVTDFMDVYWGTWHFWAFNVADASITIGAILVFADLLLVNRHASHPV
ncbi:MAG TPA: signal peptidase II [Vicinamibacterales bacterium]|nr:signal peptidase II [Vicinamibacterales bacterium]